MIPTESIRAEARRVGSIQSLFDRVLVSGNLETDLRRARWLADWLDTKFAVAGVRFGLDGVIGLVPVVGDLLGALIGVYPILVARRHGLGKRVQARMGWNLAVEWALGSIPVVGDAFDIAYKANVRNLRLLEKAAETRRRKSP